MRWSDAGVSGIDAAIEMPVLKMSPCRVLCCQVVSCGFKSSAKEGLEEEREIDRERQQVCVCIRARGTWTILGRGRTRGGAGGRAGWT